MLRNWRAWVLLVLLVGPILVYISLGFLWLRERGWLWAAGASLIWIATGVVFTLLASRWTKTTRQLLPPIDWDAPRTFSPHDRQAWELVQDESSHGATLSMAQLSTPDIYFTTGKRLAARLAAHYNPLSNDPIEHVPIVDMLTALELAAEDLDRLCRQVPGGDLITPSHWKQAVQAAGYIQKANTIYTYLLPILQPLTGIPRLVTQKAMVNPAWKNMQQNLMRWFYQAFVNRLGTHLIELYSGRLVIGAESYRKLSRKLSRTKSPAAIEEVAALEVALAGAKGAPVDRFRAELDEVRSRNLDQMRRLLAESGQDEALAARAAGWEWVEVPAYTTWAGAERARDRSTRRDAVRVAIESDLLILIVDGARDDAKPDLEFLRAWERWFEKHSKLEMPPVLVVLTGADRPDWGGEWRPPYDWEKGHRPREAAVRARLESLRTQLPSAASVTVAVGLEEQPPFGVAERVLPALAPLLHQAERAALIRQIQQTSARSKARHLATQIGRQARNLWNQRWSATKTHDQTPVKTP